MSRIKDVYEHLVQQTVCKVLFCESSEEQRAPVLPLVVIGTRDATMKTTMTEIPQDSLLHLLISTDNEHFEGPAEDEDNNVDETRRGLWMEDCPKWSIERLRREKVAIKRYLNVQRLSSADDCGKPSMLANEFLMLYEGYALLKLFLLERDTDYRQCLQQSMGCINSFLTSLHVLLALYATYFERVHGRKISEKKDVQPIETLYTFFLTHYRASEQQQTE